jgi:hypothetical protein
VPFPLPLEDDGHVGCSYDLLSLRFNLRGHELVYGAIDVQCGW